MSETDSRLRTLSVILQLGKSLLGLPLALPLSVLVSIIICEATKSTLASLLVMFLCLLVALAPKIDSRTH